MRSRFLYVLLVCLLKVRMQYGFQHILKCWTRSGLLKTTDDRLRYFYLYTVHRRRFSRTNFSYIRMGVSTLINWNRLVTLNCKRFLTLLYLAILNGIIERFYDVNLKNPPVELSLKYQNFFFFFNSSIVPDSSSLCYTRYAHAVM